MQLNRRKINVLLRLTLTFFVFVVCSFVLLSPYVVRTYETNKGTHVYLTVHTVDAATGVLDSSPGTVKAKAQAAKKMGTVEYFTSGAFLISITGVLLAFSGWILNTSIEYFIVNMGTLLGKDAAMGKAVTQAWTIIRDIINLTFVFGLIYLAFMTIARADTSKLKHGIANILIGALLINFSIFFGKAIIDIANVTAVEIYQQMSTLTTPAGTSGDRTIDVGVSGFFAQRLGVLTFLDPQAVVATSEGQNTAIDTRIGGFGFGFSIFVSLIFLVASFVFIAGGILIAIRFIVLTLLLILSPIAFAFAFLPKIHTEEWSRMWWDKMVAQALFAPAYLLLLYIAMNVANATTLAATTINPLNFFKGEGGESVVAFMNFVLIIGFLVGAIIISKKMGAYGASTAASLGNSARMYGQRTLLRGIGRGVGGATAGAAAVAGRRTFGRMGNTYANDKKLLDAAAAGSITARMKLAAARKLEKSSFDARQVGDVGKQLGVGEGRVGGYKQTLEDVAKKDEEYAKLLGTVDDNDPQVLALKAAQKRDEEKLTSLKNEKDLEKAKGDKADLVKLNKFDHDIHEQEEKIEKAKKAVDQEKNRRQIGSAVSQSEAKDSEFERLGGNIKTTKEAIEKMALKLADEKDPKIAATRRKAIHNAQKAIEDMEKQQAERLTVLRKANGITTGYAGYIDSYSKGVKGMAWSAVYGRNRQMNKESAKDLRDTYKKKDKEKKEHKPPATKPAAAASPAPSAGGGGSHGGGGAHP